MTSDSRDADLRSAFAHGRLSPQRHVIAQAVDTFDGAFTVEDLADAARLRLPRLATATTYRAVAAMTASGHILPVGSTDGSVLYARCRAEDVHHHHAVCERCGAIVCLDCPLDDIRYDMGDSGFRLTRHEFRLYGVCAACAGEKSESARKGEEA